MDVWADVSDFSFGKEGSGIVNDKNIDRNFFKFLLDKPRKSLYFLSFADRLKEMPTWKFIGGDDVLLPSYSFRTSPVG